MKANDRHEWTWWRYRLKQYGNLLHQIDLALDREDIEMLDDASIVDGCRLRGLDVTGLQREEMLEYLREWVWISKSLEDFTNMTALLLHLPILIGYNHKNRKWDADVVV